MIDWDGLKQSKLVEYAQELDIEADMDALKRSLECLHTAEQELREHLEVNGDLVSRSGRDSPGLQYVKNAVRAAAYQQVSGSGEKMVAAERDARVEVIVYEDESVRATEADQTKATDLLNFYEGAVEMWKREYVAALARMKAKAAILHFLGG